MSDGYTNMHVHCVPRDGAVNFRGWRQLRAAVLLEALDIIRPVTNSRHCSSVCDVRRKLGRGKVGEHFSPWLLMQ
jgi:hypothetical protein